jgi:hypothetical protein
VVTTRQEKLFAALSAKKWDRCGRYLSEDYRDQWNFGREDALLSLRDVGSQFFFLQVRGSEYRLQIAPDGRGGNAQAIIRLEGSGGPLAQVIQARANRIEEPFHFHWRKESWWPTAWRIVRIENAALPEDLYGYRPGDFSRALQSAANRGEGETP